MPRGGGVIGVRGGGLVGSGVVGELVQKCGGWWGGLGLGVVH